MLPIAQNVNVFLVIFQLGELGSPQLWVPKRSELFPDVDKLRENILAHIMKIGVEYSVGPGDCQSLPSSAPNPLLAQLAPGHVQTVSKFATRMKGTA